MVGAIFVWKGIMTSDDPWGSDEESPNDQSPPPGIPPGARLVAVVEAETNKQDTLAKYARLAGRPETIRYARVITDRLAELSAMGELDVPDETMGTFGLVTTRYGFHGETVKMAIKFEVDEALERSLPTGLIEIIQNATELPEALSMLCEMFFTLGYSFALDGSLAVTEGEDG